MAATDFKELPSKNQLKKVGDQIRYRAEGRPLTLDGEQAEADARLVKNWRSAHSPALTTSRIGLGTIVSRLLDMESQAGLVTQRLKRYESIVAKLVRTRPRLGEIDDIAGCRAVLPSLSLVRTVHDELGRARKLEIDRVRDYNTEPHSGGYRALHLCCRRDGFKIEIQLRTRLQQEWAELVEEWDSALGSDLKHEDAPGPALSYFRELATFFSRVDAGEPDADRDRLALRSAREDLEAWAAKEV